MPVPTNYTVFAEDKPANFEEISDVDIHAAYRIALGRAPDGGPENINARLTHAKNLAGLRRDFLSAPEFYRNNLRTLAEHTIGRAYGMLPGRVDADVDPITLTRILRHIQSVWAELGNVEPHFSVFSHPQFKPNQFSENREVFYQSGSSEVSSAMQRLKVLGLSPPAQGRAIELGCGVGRVTRFLSNHFDHVRAYDISVNHLRHAREYLDLEGIGNVELSLLGADVETNVPPHEFFYSRIVLQHNPPPVSKYLLRLFLKQLQPGGIAVFQLITGMERYQFDSNRYVEEMARFKNQELHILPQRHVFEVLDECGITAREVVRDLSAPGFHLVSTQFIGVRSRSPSQAPRRQAKVSTPQAAAEVSMTGINGLKDRSSWLRYTVPSGEDQIGITQEEFHVFRLRTPAGEQRVKSMLSIYELSLLYYLTKEYYSGHGVIVDGGPLLGVTTYALGRGLSQNCHVPEEKKIASLYTFDLFRARKYEEFLGEYRPPETGSLLHEFNRINREWLDYVVPHQGDFLTWEWGTTPIEILFLDISKSWALNRHIVKSMFPRLIPGRSVVVQQDYIHFDHYWLHLTMEHFKDKFELIGMMYGATAYYLCTSPISPEEGKIDLEALPYEKKLELLERARAAAPVPVREIMKVGAAKCAIDNGDLLTARQMLQSVNTKPLTNDPILEVSGIARSNYRHTLNALEQLEGRR